MVDTIHPLVNIYVACGPCLRTHTEDKMIKGRMPFKLRNENYLLLLTGRLFREDRQPRKRNRGPIRIRIPNAISCIEDGFIPDFASFPSLIALYRIPYRIPSNLMSTAEITIAALDILGDL